MKLGLIDWINSARTKGKITHRKIGWCNSQGSLPEALTKAQRHGIWLIETEADVILINSARVTIRPDESSVMIAQRGEVTFRNRTSSEKAVTRISPSAPPKMPRFNLWNMRPKGDDKSH